MILSVNTPLVRLLILVLQSFITIITPVYFVFYVVSWTR
jgi:hypothetical protein